MEQEKRIRARRVELFSCQNKKSVNDKWKRKTEYIFGCLMNDYKLERKFA